MTRAEFLDAVYTYGGLMGCSVTSWYRTYTHNKHVQGVAHSPHLVGLAVDVLYDVKPLEADATEWASRLGLRLIREDDHDHLQPLDWRAG